MIPKNQDHSENSAQENFQPCNGVSLLCQSNNLMVVDVCIRTDLVQRRVWSYSYCGSSNGINYRHKNAKMEEKRQELVPLQVVLILSKCSFLDFPPLTDNINHGCKQCARVGIKNGGSLLLHYDQWNSHEMQT